MSLVWTIEVSASARKQLRKIGRAQADRVTRTLIEIALLDDPRSRGIAMSGNYTGHWRYRIGDFRAIVQIEDGRMVIVVIAVGHRGEVYRR